MFRFEWSTAAKFDEERTIEELHDNMTEAVERSNYLYDEEEYDDSETNFITIIVNGVAHRFLLGGPQIFGLELFMQNICKENGYAYPGDGDTNGA